MVTYLGSLVLLCCGEGGTLQTNLAGKCGEYSQRMGHTGFAPARGGTCFLGLYCSGSRVLCKGTVQSRPCRSCTSQVYAAQIPGHSARAQTLLGMRFVHFPGLSISGDQVLCEHTVPGGPCVLITSLVQAAWFPGHALRAQVSGVPCVSSGELILGCDPPDKCPRKTWLATGSLLTILGRMRVCGARIAAVPCLLAPLCPPASLPPVRGRDLYAPS